MVASFKARFTAIARANSTRVTSSLSRWLTVVVSRLDSTSFLFLSSFHWSELSDFCTHRGRQRPRQPKPTAPVRRQEFRRRRRNRHNERPGSAHFVVFFACCRRRRSIGECECFSPDWPLGLKKSILLRTRTERSMKVLRQVSEENDGPKKPHSPRIPPDFSPSALLAFSPRFGSLEVWKQIIISSLV